MICQKKIIILSPYFLRKSIEEQIADVETKIQELQAKKKELLQVKEQEDIRRLLEP